MGIPIFLKSLLRHSEFLKYKPLVLPGMIKGFFRRIVLRQNVLRTVDLAITGDCHYRCVFCSAYKLYKKGGPFLTIGQIKDIWQQAVALGAIHINLTGGEPLLRDIGEICQIIVSLKPRRFLVSLVTSGLGLTMDKLMRLKDAGLDTLQLSIESVNPDIHDKLMGIPGSFNKIIEAIKYAKELNLTVCLNTVFYNNNAKEIKELIDFVENQNIFLVLNTASAEGKWQGLDNIKLKQSYIDILDEFMRFPYVRHDSSINFSGRRECPGGKERIHITAYGDVLTCPLVQVSYGNVLREPLAKIFARMNAIGYIKKYNRMCKHAFDEEYYLKVLQPIKNEDNRPVIFDSSTLRKEILK